MSNDPNRRLRIAHISDTHLGYRAFKRDDPDSGRNQRALDVEQAYEQAITDILERNVDLVIHSGDVFHQTHPSWIAMRWFVQQTRRLTEAKLPVVMIAGNHDTPRVRTGGTVFSLMELALPDVDFAAGYTERHIIFDRFNLNIYAVPHGRLVELQPPVILLEPGRRNVLITHGMVPGLAIRGQSEPGEEEISDALLDRDFDYIALGHYHVSSKQRHNAWYSGSTERFGWGDEDAEPGYLIVELGAPGEPPEVEHIPVAARPMKTLRPIDGEGREARDLADLVLDRLSILNQPDAMVRVEFQNTRYEVRREAERLLKREALAYVWHLQVFSRTEMPTSLTPYEHTSDWDVRTLFRNFVADRLKTGAIDQTFATTFEERGLRALEDVLRTTDPVPNVEDSIA